MARNCITPRRRLNGTKVPTRREAPALRLFFFWLCISSVFSELSRPSCAFPKDRSRLPAFATSLSRPFRLCPTATSPAFLDAWRFPRSCPQPCHISFSILSSSASHSSRQLDYESRGELLPRYLLTRAQRAVSAHSFFDSLFYLLRASGRMWARNRGDYESQCARRIVSLGRIFCGRWQLRYRRRSSTRRLLRRIVPRRTRLGAEISLHTRSRQLTRLHAAAFRAPS